MKKNVKLLGCFILFCTLFFSILNVNAKINYTSGLRCEKAVNGNSIVCDLGFEVTEKDSTVNKVTTEFTLTNVIMDSIVLEKDWYLDSKNDTAFTIETSMDFIEVGYHKIATVVFHKINEAEECTVKFKYIFDKVDRSCSNYQGKFYGLKGTLVDYLTYQKECEKHTCTILPDGTKYGKDGIVVDDLTYQKECEKHICTVLPDGTKYGKDGIVVDDLTYQKECEKHTCAVLPDGTKYGKDGIVVDDLTYQKECEKHICTVLPDGTKYGKDGIVVDDLTYQKECEKHTCTVLPDGTKYGKDGIVVDDLTYQKECGTRHVCTVIGQTYYDPNGNIVDKGTYEVLCENQIENPKTGTTFPVLTFILLVSMSLGLYTLTLKKDKFM